MPRHNVREQIVEAGLKTLLQKGFNACGVRDITDAAGVPTGSFYNHFESKEALGAEIVERYASVNSRHKALKDKTLPPLERLKRHFAGLNQMYPTSAMDAAACSAISAPSLPIKARSFANGWRRFPPHGPGISRRRCGTPRPTAPYRTGPVPPISRPFSSMPTRERCCAPGWRSPARRSIAL